MPNIEIGSLMMCLQALDTAIRHHEQFTQSETANPADDAELIFAYEREIQSLGKFYEAERRHKPDYPPLKELLPYTTERNRTTRT